MSLRIISRTASKIACVALVASALGLSGCPQAELFDRGADQPIYVDNNRNGRFDSGDMPVYTIMLADDGPEKPPGFFDTRVAKAGYQPKLDNVGNPIAADLVINSKSSGAQFGFNDATRDLRLAAKGSITVKTDIEALADNVILETENGEVVISPDVQVRNSYGGIAIDSGRSVQMQSGSSLITDGLHAWTLVIAGSKDATQGIALAVDCEIVSNGPIAMSAANDFVINGAPSGGKSTRPNIITTRTVSIEDSNPLLIFTLRGWIYLSANANINIYRAELESLDGAAAAEAPELPPIYIRSEDGGTQFRVAASLVTGQTVLDRDTSGVAPDTSASTFSVPPQQVTH